MDMKDLSRNVKLYCDICGNDQFELLDEEFINLKEAPETVRMRCSDCGKIFTKAELIEENQRVIDANVEDIRKEAVKEVEKELKKALKKLR